MTTSRIVRGTKARVFLYICAVLIITGIIACYNNTLSQLEDARKSSEICHQQEENLSTQLQVISDYKQRLEKSLKTEKAEHQQAKNDLENKLNEEKSKNEKAINDANLRFSSLQQHFNLLQTQHDDFKEECSKSQSKQMNEINDLQAKLKEVQEELKKVEMSKENLKSQYLQLQVDKENLQKQLKTNLNNADKSEINHLTKANHELQRELTELKAKCSAYESIQPPNVIQESSSPHNSQNASRRQAQIEASEVRPDDTAKHEAQMELRQQVQAPSNQNFIKIPTKSTTSSSLKVSQGSLNGARPLLVPTVTPKGAHSAAPPLPYAKRLPEGVVPVPEKRDVDKKTEEERNELPDETVNNRYRNKINDNAFKEEAKKVDEVDKENVANEVFDQPVHMGAYDTLGFGDLNDPIKNAEKQNYNKQHIDNLGVGDKEGNKAYDNEYKDNQNDMQLEENDPEDDDPDEYGDHLGRLKDPVVRN